MKIRNGFVSNSSSSSYVIVIPDDFDVDSLVYDNLDKMQQVYRDSNEYRKANPWKKGEPLKPKVIIPYEFIDNFINKFKKCIKKRYIYQDEYDIFYPITNVMEDYIVSDVETGPDSGVIKFVTEKQLRSKLDKMKNIDKISDEKKDQLREKMKKERDEWEIQAKIEKEEKERKEKMKYIDPYAEEQWEE